MHAVVVYESMFGNTREVAKAVREGIAPMMPVELYEVGSAPHELRSGVTLLVVGAPTHAFSLSRPSTREDAAQHCARPLVSRGIGVREWLGLVSPVPPGLRFATFDTRVATPHLPGSAARAAHTRLRRLGATEIAPPQSFWVDGTPGPLLAGQRESARQWAADLAVRALALPTPAGRAG
jgi:hypothetical protein